MCCLGRSTPHYVDWFAFQTTTMMTSSNGNMFRVTGHLCGEFTVHRWIPRTKASDAELWCFFELRLNKRLSKPSRDWWFETSSRPLWRQSNDYADWVYEKWDGRLVCEHNTTFGRYIEVLVQDSSNSCALAKQSCTKPSVWATLSYTPYIDTLCKKYVWVWRV